MKASESAAKGAVLDRLESLRWDVVHGSDISTDMRGAECVDYRAVVLEGRWHHTRNAFSPCERGS